MDVYFFVVLELVGVGDQIQEDLLHPVLVGAYLVWDQLIDLNVYGVSPGLELHFEYMQYLLNCFLDIEERQFQGEIAFFEQLVV